MTVKELIAHLQTFDENAIIVYATSDYYGDSDHEGVYITDTNQVEAVGKYVILFNERSYSEADIEEFLS